MKFREAIDKNQVNENNRFWVLIANEDRSGAQELVRELIHNEREDCLRWIAIDGKTTLKTFLPPWVDPLLNNANLAAANIATKITAAIQRQKGLIEQATEKDSPEPCPPVKKVKDLMESGMLCQLRAIWGYEEELQMTKNLLEPYHTTRVIVIIPLLDTGHIYIQANVKYDESASHNFKMAGPYIKFRDSGTLVSLVREKRIQKVIVTEERLYDRISSHPSLKQLRNILVLERHSLPYTSTEVEFK